MLHSTTGQQSDVVIKGDRNATTAAHAETYAASSKAIVGPYTLTATFYAAAAEGGGVSATATANVALSAAGTFTAPDGTALGTIAFTGAIRSVVVGAGQATSVGKTTQIVASAYDAGTNLIALAPGSFQFAVTGGNANGTITSDGLLTGVSAGSVTVTATVDGVTSTGATVQVLPPTVTPVISVDWPARSRSLVGPGSALSVKVVLHSSNSAIADVEIDGNRSAGLAAHTDSFTRTGQTPIGLYSLTATFYSQVSQEGIVTATASASVAVASTGAITNADGTPLGAISFTGKVQSVTIDANQSVAVNASAQVKASARDSNNNILALTPGSFQFSIVSGASFATITPGGMLSGVAQGAANVVATVDGTSSAATAVQIVPPSAAPVVSVDWPERTRGLTGPSSALSVKVILHSVSGLNQDLEIDGNRSTNLAAHTERYTSAGIVFAGAYTLTATFYSQASLAGIVTATASANVAVSPTGEITNPDGTTLGAINFTGVVASVAIDASQTVIVNGTTQLTVVVKDASNNALALSPGSFLFTLTSGAADATITKDGILSGVAAGTVTVTATVDGVTSPAVNVQVLAQPDFVNNGFETPQIAINTSQADGPTGFQWTGTFTSGTNTWGIANGATSWGAAGHTGAQYAFIQDGATITQTVTGLTVGKAYVVKFWCARRSGGASGNAACKLTVTANGTAIYGPFQPADDGSWGQYTTGSYTATATSCTFVFKTTASSTDSTDLLDDVHLIPAG